MWVDILSREQKIFGEVQTCMLEEARSRKHGCIGVYCLSSLTTLNHDEECFD
jgi:hypothetical protein